MTASPRPAPKARRPAEEATRVIAKIESGEHDDRKFRIGKWMWNTG